MKWISLFKDFISIYKYIRMDLKNVLKDKDKETNDNIRKHKKPMQLRDIESRSTSKHKKIVEDFKTDEDIEKMLEDEKKSIYLKPWNKLDNGHKLNRIKKYISSLKEEYDLNENDIKKTQKLLMNACNENKLNRISDIDYNKEEGYINKIKILEINEKDGKKQIHLKLVEQKTKSTPKSKSNIDRFLKSGSLKNKNKK